MLLWNGVLGLPPWSERLSLFFQLPCVGLTHICGLHGMVEQGQVLHVKDLCSLFHQRIQYDCGQANEPGETRSRYEILSQAEKGVLPVLGIALARESVSSNRN